MTTKETLEEAISEYFQVYNRSITTKRLYNNTLVQLSNWCNTKHIEILPLSITATKDFIQFLLTSGTKYSTILAKLSTIHKLHVITKNPSVIHSPEINNYLDEIRNNPLNRSFVEKSRKTKISADDIIKLFSSMPLTKLSSVRDRAIFLLAFCGNLRVGEIVNLDCSDIVFETSNKMVVTTIKRHYWKNQLQRHSFTSNMQQPILCPVNTMKEWLYLTQIKSGPIFRGISKCESLKAQKLSTQNVRLIIKKYMGLAGYVPFNFSGNSLRPTYWFT